MHMIQHSLSLSLVGVPRLVATPCQYYPQSTAPDMVKMAEKEIPGVVMDHKKEWRQQKRDLDEGTSRGKNLLQQPRDTPQDCRLCMTGSKLWYRVIRWTWSVIYIDFDCGGRQCTSDRYSGAGFASFDAAPTLIPRKPTGKQYWLHVQVFRDALIGYIEDFVEQKTNSDAGIELKFHNIVQWKRNKTTDKTAGSPAVVVPKMLTINVWHLG